MNIKGKAYRTIWLGKDGRSVEIIDQTKLPHALEIVTLRTLEDVARAIKTMQVRGAPLIGAAAAYGVCLALSRDASDEALDAAIELLAAQRPTAVNLRWALDEMRHAVRNLPREKRLAAAYARAAELCDEDVENEYRHRPAWAGADRAGRRAQEARRAPSTSSRIATPAGSPASTAARPPHRSTRRTTAASHCTCGSTRRGRAIRVRR